MLAEDTHRETRTFPVPLPARMRHLPIDRRGYPVPAFVEWIEGQPDFRVMSQKHFARCVRHGACWICGDRLGQHKTFVIGPMCGINRVSAEPPCHADCAAFAAIACPFMARPQAKRRKANLPQEVYTLDGHIERNPGLSLLWTTRSYRLMQHGPGFLFLLGEPTSISFWAHGRAAKRPEVDHAIETGLPTLYEAAKADGGPATVELHLAEKRFQKLIDRVFQ